MRAIGPFPFLRYMSFATGLLAASAALAQETPAEDADPQPASQWISLFAGGDRVASYTDYNTGGVCEGHFSDAPVFQLVLEPGQEAPLTVFVDSGADTLLLIYTPGGDLHCSDDYQISLNPGIELETPQAGAYDIWIGTYDAPDERLPEAALGWVRASGVPSPNLTDVFFGEDEREVLDSFEAPWSMIGLVEMENASCTGVLVGPSTVLTAGHCILDGGMSDRALDFFAGYSDGSSVASSAVTGSHIPNGWRNGEQDGYDYAFLFLAEPLGEQLGWMEIGALTAQDITAIQAGSVEILQAGYSYDQPGSLTGHLGCPFVAVVAPNELHHECDTLQGDSGSPLFIETPTGYRIIGVESHSRPHPDSSNPYPLNVAMHADFVAAELAGVINGTLTQTLTKE